MESLVQAADNYSAGKVGSFVVKVGSFVGTVEDSSADSFEEGFSRHSKHA